jgi:hypothetical protein
MIENELTENNSSNIIKDAEILSNHNDGSIKELESDPLILSTSSIKNKDSQVFESESIEVVNENSIPKTYESVIKPTNSFNFQPDLRLKHKKSIDNKDLFNNISINLQKQSKTNSILHQISSLKGNYSGQNNNYTNNINIHFNTYNNQIIESKQTRQEPINKFQIKRNFNSKLMDVYNELSQKPIKNRFSFNNIESNPSINKNPEDEFNKFYNDFKSKKLESQKKSIENRKPIEINERKIMNTNSYSTLSKLDSLMKSNLIGNSNINKGLFSLQEEMIDLDEEINNFKTRHINKEVYIEKEEKDNDFSNIGFDENELKFEENEGWNKIITDDNHIECSPVKSNKL